MRWYKIYGTRQYSTYVEAESKREAIELAEKIPLKDWEPNEAGGEEIYPKEACL